MASVFSTTYNMILKQWKKIMLLKIISFRLGLLNIGLGIMCLIIKRVTVTIPSLVYVEARKFCHVISIVFHVSKIYKSPWEYNLTTATLSHLNFSIVLDEIVLHTMYYVLCKYYPKIFDVIIITVDDECTKLLILFKTFFLFSGMSIYIICY